MDVVDLKAVHDLPVIASVKDGDGILAVTLLLYQCHELTV